MSRLHVVAPGLLTTVQDLGRPGWQRHGVSPGGAVDARALRIANLLVGNPEEAAGLEITLVGPTLRFLADALVAVAGAECRVTVNNRRVPAWRPVRLAPGATLAFGPVRSGCRVYLGVSGGIAVPRVLDGRGTHLAAGFGGFWGRTLRAGDLLKYGLPSAWAVNVGSRLTGPGPFVAAHWTVSPDARAAGVVHPEVRAMRGPQWDWFAPEAQAGFLGEPFPVTAHSDRMGLRLEAPEPLRTALAGGARPDMISEGVAEGAVQVAPDGRPIILLADRQTIGGYPKIAQVATVDLPLLAQTRPGDTIRFREVTVAEAQSLLVEAEHLMATVRHGIALHAG